MPRPNRITLVSSTAALVTLATFAACNGERSASVAGDEASPTSASVANDAAVAMKVEARPRRAMPAAPPVAEQMAADVSLQAAAGVIGGGAAGAANPGGVTTADIGDVDDRIAPDMVIRSGTASVQVDSIDVAVQRVRQLAQRVGGVIANSSLQGGKDQVRTATLEVKVAAARFEDLVTGLTPFGKLESVNVTAEEVGEEYVDVSARVANARRLEARLIDLLANRTGKLSDVLTVERELARVREEIERYEGRLRYLKSRSAVSTLAITVHEPLPLLAGSPPVNPIAQAFREAWRNFVGLLAAVIASLGVLVPLAGIAALGWLGYRKLRRTVRVEQRAGQTA